MKIIDNIINYIYTHNPYGEFKKITNPDKNGIIERTLIDNIELLPIEQQFYLIPYYWTGNQLIGKIVLDAGCGMGSTTIYLSKYAKSIIGIDISSISISYAKQHFNKSNCIFKISDIRKINYPNSSFDAVTSFEVIEHLNEHDQIQYINEIYRILKPKGQLFFSTPNKIMTDGKNSFHIRELSIEQLQKLLSYNFINIEIFGVSSDSIITNLPNNSNILFGKCLNNKLTNGLGVK